MCHTPHRGSRCEGRLKCGRASVAPQRARRLAVTALEDLDEMSRIDESRAPPYLRGRHLIEQARSQHALGGLKTGVDKPPAERIAV